MASWPDPIAPNSVSFRCHIRFPFVAIFPAHSRLLVLEHFGIKATPVGTAVRRA